MDNPRSNYSHSSCSFEKSLDNGRSQIFREVASQKLGRINIIMSNSGIEHFGDLENVTEAEIDKVLGVNVKAQFFVAQEAHKYLENNGRLILISSISAVWVRFPVLTLS